jgi:hypothetical protein
MRSYVFTRKEREVISAYLRGEIRASDDIMRQVFVRMRSFKDLSSDVETYLILKGRVAESSPTASA